MVPKRKKIIWIDVGTHFAQEHSSLFGSISSFYLHILKRFIGGKLLRRGKFVGAYLNGELKGSTSSSRDLSNTSAKTWIGQRPNLSRPLDTTSLALLRMSASAPSDEQVKKMYEDEKVLFRENAKATLYGSSDAVTALGYDEDTELLHVGTSSGRSDFQGLRRINNTTTAVSTAISASNSLIVEQ